jgi:hypothetical protein
MALVAVEAAFPCLVLWELFVTQLAEFLYSENWLQDFARIRLAGFEIETWAGLH